MAAGAIVVLALAALAGEFLVWPDWDTTWLIAAARMMGDGATLYSADLIEVNPPTVLEFARLSVVASGWLGISAITAWRLLVFAVELLSVALSWSILRAVLPDEARAWRLPVAVVLAAALTCLPGINFGQREHLILLLVTPYVIASAAHLDGLRLGRLTLIACGLLLAVAISIKPHYLLLILAVECGVVFAGGVRLWWRPETVSAGLALVLLAAIELWSFPGYLSFAVPYAWRYYREYAAFHWLPSYVGYPAGGLLPVLFYRRYGHGVRSTAPQQLLAAGLGAFLALLQQAKGWDYHYVPGRGLLFLSGTLALILLLAGPISAWWRRPLGLPPAVVAMATGLALMLPLGVLMVRRTQHINASHWPQEFARLQQLLDAHRPADRTFTMTTLSVELFPAFPVVEMMGGHWASRFSCLWTVPAIEAREREGQTPRSSGRADLTGAVAADLARYRPTFVLVQPRRSAVIDDLLRAPQVHATLQAYEPIGEVGDIVVLVRHESEK